MNQLLPLALISCLSFIHFLLLFIHRPSYALFHVHSELIALSRGHTYYVAATSIINPSASLIITLSLTGEIQLSTDINCSQSIHKPFVWNTWHIHFLKGAIAADWLDLDGDGYLDLVVAHGFRPGCPFTCRWGEGELGWLQNPGSNLSMEHPVKWKYFPIAKNIPSIHRVRVWKDMIIAIPIVGPFENRPKECIESGDPICPYLSLMNITGFTRNPLNPLVSSGGGASNTSIQVSKPWHAIHLLSNYQLVHNARVFSFSHKPIPQNTPPQQNTTTIQYQNDDAILLVPHLNGIDALQIHSNTLTTLIHHPHNIPNWPFPYQGYSEAIIARISFHQYFLVSIAPWHHGMVYAYPIRRDQITGELEPVEMSDGILIDSLGDGGHDLQVGELDGKPETDEIIVGMRGAPSSSSAVMGLFVYRWDGDKWIKWNVNGDKDMGGAWFSGSVSTLDVMHDGRIVTVGWGPVNDRRLMVHELVQQKM